MTIFDSIKYPISAPPTEQELAALPPDLFNVWKEKVGFTKLQSPISVAYWFDFEISLIDLEKLDMLRQMIKDYDNI